MSKIQSVISGRELPKDLQGFDGLSTGFNPPSVYESRILLTGEPGSGKSTFLNSNEHLFILDDENGGKTVGDPKALRFKVPVKVPPSERDRAYINMVQTIVDRRIKGATDIKMVGIDSLDELIETFSRALCLRSGVEDIGDVGGGHGKGYFIVRRAIVELLDNIHNAGMGWIVVAHSATSTERVGNNIVRQSSLSVSDTFKRMIFRKCDHFLFLESGLVLEEQPPIEKIVGGKKISVKQDPISKQCRLLRTRPGGLWEGSNVTELKVRVPLRDKIELPAVGGFGTFESEYNISVSDLIGENKNG